MPDGRLQRTRAAYRVQREADPIIMCGCDAWTDCEHPWPAFFLRPRLTNTFADLDAVLFVAIADERQQRTGDEGI